MSKKYYSKEETQLITILYKENKSLKEIAAITDRSVDAIRGFLSRNKISQGGSCSHKKILELAPKIIEEYSKNINASAISIAKKFGVSDASVLKVLNQAGIDTKYANGRNSALPNIHLFNQIDTEEKAYWLGFLYADGSIDRSKRTLSLTQMKKGLDILEKFCQFIGISTSIIKTRPSRPDEYRIAISSVVLCKDLINHGIIPNKTYLGILPEVQAPLTKHFVRGLWDGDGAIKENRCIQLTGSKDTTEKVLNWLIAQGIDSAGIKIYSYKPTTYQLVINRYAVGDEITKLLYKDATIYLNRKNPYHNCPSAS